MATFQEKHNSWNKMIVRIWIFNGWLPDTTILAFDSLGVRKKHYFTDIFISGFVIQNNRSLCLLLDATKMKIQWKSKFFCDIHCNPRCTQVFLAFSFSLGTAPEFKTAYNQYPYIVLNCPTTVRLYQCCPWLLSVTRYLFVILKIWFVSEKWLRGRNIIIS